MKVIGSQEWQAALEREFDDLVQVRELIDKHMNIVDKLSALMQRGSFKAISHRLCVRKL